MWLYYKIFLASSICWTCRAFRNQIQSLRLRHLSSRVVQMSNELNPDSNEKKKKNFFNQISPNHYDYNQMNDETISRDFLPSGPDDLATLETTKVQKSGLLSKSNPASRYLSVIEGLSPGEMIQKFAMTAPNNVQEAAKSTVVNILGNLPNYALDADLITTSSKLSNLLHQMQMTGYMFKNAEYRMSFTLPLKGLPRLSTQGAIYEEENIADSLKDTSHLPGQIMVRTTSGQLVEVQVSELSDALSREVVALKSELMSIREEKEKELRSNLLTYIQALPDDELARLTSDVSPEVVDTIHLVVNSLLDRLGIDTEGPEVVIQQNMNAMAQLCMWHMVMGYKLRELEALDRGVSLY